MSEVGLVEFAESEPDCTGDCEGGVVPSMTGNAERAERGEPTGVCAVVMRSCDREGDRDNERRILLIAANCSLYKA